MNKAKKVFLVAISTCMALLLTVYLFNYILLQNPLSDVINLT